MTVKYLFGNFWRVFLTLIPISVLCAFFIKPLTSVTALFYITAEEFHDPKDLIESLDFATEWYYIFVYLAITLLIAAFLSYAYITMYRHMRTGKISIRTPLRYMNGGFIPFAKMLLCIFVYIILMQLIISGVLVLFNSLFSSLSIPYWIFRIIAYVLILFIFLFSNFMLKTPLMMVFHMYVYGYGLMEAWSANGKLLHNKFSVTMFFATLIPLLTIVALNFTCLLLTVPYWLEIVIRTVVYFFVFAYFIALAITVMFDLCEIERRDVPRYRR
ncbi:MAG: hypothetical protein J6C23_05785 [Clostridia bacterium]|nr:hypothetical protein [Clostridia bacterium]